MKKKFLGCFWDSKEHFNAFAHTHWNCGVWHGSFKILGSFSFQWSTDKDLCFETVFLYLPWPHFNHICSIPHTLTFICICTNSQLMKAKIFYWNANCYSKYGCCVHQGMFWCPSFLHYSAHLYLGSLSALRQDMKTTMAQVKMCVLRSHHNTL